MESNKGPRTLNGLDKFDVVEMRPNIEPILCILASSTPADPQDSVKKAFIIEMAPASSILGPVREDAQDYHRRTNLFIPVSAVTAHLVGEGFTAREWKQRWIIILYASNSFQLPYIFGSWYNQETYQNTVDIPMTLLFLKRPDVYLKMRCYFQNGLGKELRLVAISDTKKYFIDSIYHGRVENLDSEPSRFISDHQINSLAEEGEQIIAVDVMELSRHFVACTNRNRCVVVNFISQSERVIQVSERITSVSLLKYQAYLAVVDSQKNTVGFYHVPEASQVDDPMIAEIADTNL